MTYLEFIQKNNNFPDTSRVWLYQANRKLSAQEQTLIQEELSSFTQQWAAHGKGLKATYGIVYDALIVLMVDQTQESASGCSIDSSVHFVKALGAKYGFDCFNRNVIAYLKDGEISFTNLQQLDQAKGAQVFNIALTHFGDFKEQLVINFEDSALSRVNIDTSFTLSL